MSGMMKKFMTDESGQGLTEYALIIALVAVALVVALITLKNGVGNAFNKAQAQLT